MRELEIGEGLVVDGCLAPIILLADKFDPNLGTPEELAQVENARDKFCQNII